MDETLKELENQWGDVKDCMGLQSELRSKEAQEIAYKLIILKSIKLIIGLLFYIIRHMH